MTFHPGKAYPRLPSQNAAAVAAGRSETAYHLLMAALRRACRPRPRTRGRRAGGEARAGHGGARPTGGLAVDSERVTASILDGTTVLAAGIPVTIFRDAADLAGAWRCEFEQPRGVKFQSGRFYRVQTDDGRSGACSLSGFTGGGFFQKPPVVRMAGLGQLK